MGKNLGALNKELSLNWLTKISSIPALSKEGTASLIREYINGDDFEALPGDVQMANARDIEGGI
ncbi:MAM domain-containing protein 2 [Platysternon megacephalum]|uniref:MAM domain-containing protein 2 n=1 Tax=Platysternon megacephalum TaxID=55544 RepID=A0A4D9FDE7_9SAUR|nr:MAM domain-containing protein 2 [Platysternon megacephalum]